MNPATLLPAIHQLRSCLQESEKPIYQAMSQQAVDVKAMLPGLTIQYVLLPSQRLYLRYILSCVCLSIFLYEYPTTSERIVITFLCG